MCPSKIIAFKFSLKNVYLHKEIAVLQKIRRDFNFELKKFWFWGKSWMVFFVVPQKAEQTVTHRKYNMWTSHFTSKTAQIKHKVQ